MFRLFRSIPDRIGRAGMLPRLPCVMCLAVAAGVCAVQVWTLDVIARAETRGAARALDIDRALLKQELGRLGTEWRISADGDLTLGGISLQGRQDLVDEVGAVTGGVATIFAGDIRVATNIDLPDGTRAVGTRLAAGPARDAVIGRGETYRGVTDILGTPYLTIYEPLRDPAGQQIGVLFSGQPLDEQYAAVRRLVGESTLAGLILVFTAITVSWWASRPARPLPRRSRAMAGSIPVVARDPIDLTMRGTKATDQHTSIVVGRTGPYVPADAGMLMSLGELAEQRRGWIERAEAAARTRDDMRTEVADSRLPVRALAAPEKPTTRGNDVVVRLAGKTIVTREPVARPRPIVSMAGFRKLSAERIAELARHIGGIARRPASWR